MRLDRTKIAIRERSLFDILDMALRVLFVYFGPLLFCMLLLVVPLMVINWLLIGWMPEYGDWQEGIPRYIWTMILLVAIQAPLVSIFATSYLGQVMFADEVDWPDIWSTVGKSLLPLTLSHILFRGIGLSWLLAWMIPRSSNYSGIEVWLIFLALYAILIRATRPFINEIILLERNPLVTKDENAITIRRRSSALHGPNSGDLVSRSMAGALIAVVLVLSILATLWFAWGMLLFDWNWGPVMLHLCFPLALWLTAVYFAVVRFLCYLDLRIRREGWEVELVMRAAAAQVTGPVV